MGTGCSSSRPTPPLPPSTSSCSTSWARSTRRSRPRSRFTCAACRARTADGRCSTAAPFNISASVKAYLALKLAGDDPARGAHAPGARGHSRPRRCRHDQRLHPHPAGAVRSDLLGGGADHSGRDHVSAALVSVPPGARFVLEPDRSGAAAGPAGAQAAGAQSARRADRRAVSGTPARRAAGRSLRTNRASRFVVFAAIDAAIAFGRAIDPAAACAGARSTARSRS